MGVSMAFEASCEHCMRPAEAEGWIEHSAVRVLSKSSALQWECHLSNGIKFFLGQRSIVRLRKMLATTPFPQAVVELAQKAPWQTSVWEAVCQGLLWEL